MNVETKTHIIRLGTKEDIEAVQLFIHEEWKENHILAKNRAFFEYEHIVDERLNVILAVNKETNKVDAIWAFYQSSHKLSDCDLWGGIWSVSRYCKVPMLGQLIIRNFSTLTQGRSHSGVGINARTTAQILKRTKGQTVGILQHYYMLSNRDEYDISVITDKKIIEPKPGKSTLILFNSMEEMKEHFTPEQFLERKPYKDEWFLEKRYFKHPIYSYRVWGIQDGGKTKAVIVGREITHNGAIILRIVDYIGEDNVLGSVGTAFKLLLSQNGYEYIDFYQHGLSHGIMEDAGFVLKTEEDLNIIPNYFEPFVQKNIDIWYHTSFSEPYYVFKADADQDRPNRLRGAYDEQ